MPFSFIHSDDWQKLEEVLGLPQRRFKGLAVPFFVDFLTREIWNIFFQFSWGLVEIQLSVKSVLGLNTFAVSRSRF